MNFDYNLSPLQILDILGCQPAPDFQPDESLPQMLNDFLSRTLNNPLFRTADIWQAGKAYFYYESIAECIEENEAYWAEHPEKRTATELDPFAARPQTEWPQLVDNYLEIGSDYAAGVVEFGIKEADLGQENPPVYIHYEDDDTQTWVKFSDSLTDFLMFVLCGVLSCSFYHTGQEVLAKAGWVYTQCDKPEQVGRWHCCLDETNAACGYDREQNALISLLECGEYNGYIISRQ